ERSCGGRARVARGRDRAPGGQLRRGSLEADLRGRRREGDRAHRGRRWRWAADHGPRRGKEPGRARRCAHPGAGADRRRPGMKVLALDYGSARTGIAVSDPTGTVARPVGVAERVGTAAGFEQLVKTIRDEQPERVVIGLPLTL